MVPGHAAARAPATWRGNRDRVRGADRRPAGFRTAPQPDRFGRVTAMSRHIHDAP